MTGFPGPVLMIAAGALLVSTGLSGVARRYALSRSLLDVPNERSLHASPTPRGGGIAIAAVVLAGLVLLAAQGSIDTRVAVALGGGGALVAAVGWLDDRRGLSATARLLVHAAAAIWAVGWLGGMPYLTVGETVVRLGLAGTVLAIVTVVWSVNLYNFMDGIDGLAAGEAVAVGLIAAALLGRAHSSQALVALLVAAAAAGFLGWNWPPARLFMGDVGSGFLGFMFAAAAVASQDARVLPAPVWLILVAPFFVDATVTLVRRMARGERWTSAHRLHAYQRAVQGGCSHLQVTAVVLGLDLGLGGIAWLVTAHPRLLGAGLALATACAGVLYWGVERRVPMRSEATAGSPTERRSDT